MKNWLMGAMISLSLGLIPSNEFLEKKELLEQSLTKFDTRYHNGKILREASRYSLNELQDIKRFSDTYGKLTIDLVDEVAYLMDNGLDTYYLEKINYHTLEELVDGFTSGRYSEEYILSFGNPNDFETYTKKAAESNPNFPETNEEISDLQEQIISRLELKNQLPRKNARYDESFEQISDISNPYTLSLLEMYLSFFENNSEEISQFFTEEYPNEEGGVFFFDEGLKFSRMRNDMEKYGGNPKDSYTIPLIRNYVPNIGLLHTHPQQENEEIGLFAGPSGVIDPFFLFEHYKGDLGALRQISEVNPYTMEIVITQLPENKCNIDAYFLDLEEPSPKNVRVVDLGIFDY